MNSRPVTPEEWARIQAQYGGNPSRNSDDIPYDMIPVEHDPFEPAWYQKLAQGAGNFLQGLSLEGMAKGIYGAAKNAATYPGDVLTGKKAYSPEEAVKWAADTTGLLGGRGLAGAPEGVGVFGGNQGLTAPKAQIAAREFAEKMFGPKAVSQDTAHLLPYKPGTPFKGPEGGWRYEIPAEARLTPEVYKNHADMTTSLLNKNMGAWKGALSDIVDYPGLFEAYPQLKQTPTYIEHLGFGSLGGFNPETKTLHLNTNLSNPGKLSVLEHELQHKIQDIEGWPGGGNMYGQNVQEVMAQHPMVKEMDELQKHYNTLINKFPKHPAAKELKDKINSLSKALHKKRFETYQRIAGEAEARNVQQRQVITNPELYYAMPKSERQGLGLQHPAILPTRLPQPFATYDMPVNKLLLPQGHYGALVPISKDYDLFGNKLIGAPSK